MTTPPPPPPPTGPDDARDPGRDPRVAGWLAVEPLDEVTRSRLVRTALAGAAVTEGSDSGDEGADAGVVALPPASRRRSPYATLVSVAAAVLVALVVVGAVLLPGDDDTSTPTAQRAPATAAAPGSRQADDSLDDSAFAPEGSALTDSAEMTRALPSIGDLGDVSTEAKLERAARAALSVPAGTPTGLLTGCAAAAGAASGTPVATGTGRIDDRPAIVVVSEQAAGTTTVVAVRGRSCGRSVMVVLP